MERGGILVIRVFILILLAIASQVNASECDINTANFPEDDCSFSPPFETQYLKFGNLDEVFNAGHSIRIGAAEYDLLENVEIFDASESDCDYDYDELGSDDEGQEVAFKVSETNSREITQIWLLDCKVEIAR
jgi:hypothetical protein